MARVLVVDDDPAQQFLFLQLLRKTGFDAIGADSGGVALDLLAQDAAFDVILTDMNMPGMNGVEFIDALQRYYPRIPVVLMSVRAVKDWNLDPRAVGSRYLQKPFDRDRLVHTLYYAINRGATQAV